MNNGLTAAEKRAQRKQMTDNVFAFKHNKRIPLVSNVWTWNILDAGYGLSEVIYDYDLLEKLNCEFIQDYQFDVYCNVGTRNMMAVTDCLGGGVIKISKSDDSVYTSDHVLLMREEYPQYIENQDKVFWEKVFKRYCKKDITIGELQRAMEEWIRFQELNKKMYYHYYEEDGALDFFGGIGIPDPWNFICDSLRGLKEFSIDLRKNKNELKEIIAKAAEEMKPMLERSLTMENPAALADFATGFLMQNIINKKQFEEIWWPYMKQAIDFAAEHKKTICLYAEGTVLQYADFLADVPKGVLAIMLESDDVFEFRKRLPDIAIIGGMPSSLLNNGSKEECIDYAKKLIDTLGDGFMFSSDKMLSYRNDAKRENMLAVNDFVRNYQY